MNTLLLGLLLFGTGTVVDRPWRLTLRSFVEPARPQYQITARTRFFVDGEEVFATVFYDKAGKITEMEINRDGEVITIKAKRK